MRPFVNHTFNDFSTSKLFQTKSLYLVITSLNQFSIFEQIFKFYEFSNYGCWLLLLEMVGRSIVLMFLVISSYPFVLFLSLLSQLFTQDFLGPRLLVNCFKLLKNIFGLFEDKFRISNGYKHELYSSFLFSYFQF
jgi:hypothetical protein